MNEVKLEDIMFSLLSVCAHSVQSSTAEWRIVRQKCIRLVRETLRIFPYCNIPLESMFHCLSGDIVRFKIEVGVEEKCTKI